MNTMDNMTIETGAAQGWQCPICKTINSPWTRSCDCVNMKPTVTTYGTGFDRVFKKFDISKDSYDEHLTRPRPLSILQSLKLCKVLIDNGIDLDEAIDVAEAACFVCNLDTYELYKLTEVQLREYMEKEDQ